MSVIPRVNGVKASDDYTLILHFENNETRLFDMKPYLKIGVFKTLKEENKFRQVKIFLGSIQWPEGQDLSPDTLYLKSKPEK